MKGRSEFIQKTNDDVNAWMDEFYVDGRNADFRLHCQWSWQEQERRHNAIEDDLILALKNLMSRLDPHDYPDEQDAAKKAIAKALA